MLRGERGGGADTRRLVMQRINVKIKQRKRRRKKRENEDVAMTAATASGPIKSKHVILGQDVVKSDAGLQF